MLPNLSHSLITVHHRHHHIHKNKINIQSGSQQLKRFLPVVGGQHLDAFLLQSNRKAIDVADVIIND